MALLVVTFLPQPVAAQSTVCTPDRWCRLVTPESVYRYAANLEPQLSEFFVSHSQQLTRDDAVTFCAERGGTLVSFKDADAVRTLLTLLPAATWANAWSGLQFDSKENAYIFAADLSKHTPSPDLPVMHSRKPCYYFSAGRLGLEVQGDVCNIRRSVACERRNFNTGWERVGVTMAATVFTAQAERDEAADVCRYYGGDLGFVPTYSMMGKFASLAVGAGAVDEKSATKDADGVAITPGLWTQLVFDSSTLRFGWPQTYGMPTWTPSVDNGVSSNCVYLRVPDASPQLSGLATVQCGSPHAFICTRKFPVVSVSLPPPSAWTAVEGRLDSAADAATGTVTVRPSPDETLTIGLREAHPAELRLDTTFVIIEAGQTTATFTVNRIGAVSETFIFPTIVGQDDSNFDLRPGKLTYARTMSRSISPSIRPDTTGTMSMTLSPRPPLGPDETLPPPAVLPPPPGPPAPTRNRAASPGAFRVPTTPAPTKYVRFVWNGAHRRVIYMGDDTSIDRRVTVSVRPWAPVPANATLTVTPLVRDMAGNNVTGTAVLPRLPAFDRSDLTFYVAAFQTGRFTVSFDVQCSWDSYPTLPQPMQIEVKPRVRPLFTAPGVSAMRYTQTTVTRYSAKVNVIERPRSQVRFTASQLRGTATIVFPDGADVVFGAGSYWLERDLVIACDSTGTAEVRLSMTQGPEYYISDDLYISVACTAPASFGFTDVATPQIVSPSTIIPVTVTAGQLPSPGREVQLDIKHSVAPPCFEITPAQITWTSTSPSVRSFTMRPTRECDGELRYTLTGSAAKDYTSPDRVTLAAITASVLNVALTSSSSNKVIVGGIDESPASVTLRPTRLPDAGQTIEVLLRASGPGAEFVIVQPATVLVTGGSSALREFPITILSTKDGAKADTLTEPLEVTIAPVIIGGSHPDRMLLGTSADVTVAPSKTISVDVASLSLVEGDTNKKTVNVVLSALPVGLRETLNISWKSPVNGTFLRIEPAAVILDRDHPTNVIAFNFTGLVAATDLYAELTVSGIALYEYRMTQSAIATDERIRELQLLSIEDRRQAAARITLPVSVTPRTEVTVAEFPRLVHLNDGEGAAFFVTCPVDSLGFGESVRVDAIPQSPNIAVSPSSFEWTAATTTGTVVFRIRAWGDPQEAAQLLLNVSQAPVHFSRTVNPPGLFTTQTVTMVNVLIDVPSVLYVGQDLASAIALRLRPGGDDFLSESSAPSEFTFVDITPQYNGTDRALGFRPQLMRFDNTRAKPLRLGALVQCTAASPPSELTARLTGPSGADYVVPTRYIEVRSVNVTVRNVPRVLFAGETGSFIAEISHLPTCGEFRLTTACAGCDAVRAVPELYRWTPTSKSLRIDITVLAVAVVSPYVSLSFAVERTCAETDVPIPVFVDAAGANVTVLQRPTPVLYYPAGSGEARRVVDVLRVPRDGSVDVEIDISSSISSLAPPLPAPAIFGLGYTAGGLETLSFAPGPTVEIAANGSMTRFTVFGHRTRSGTNSSLRVESMSQYRFQSVEVPVVVTERANLWMTGLDPFHQCVVGDTLRLTIQADGFPAAGGIAVDIVAADLSVLGDRTTWSFSRQDPLSVSVSVRCNTPNIAATFRLAARGTALSFYNIQDPIAFEVHFVGEITMATTPAPPAVATLAAGQKKSIILGLLLAPPDLSANVWVLPTSNITGAVVFEPRAVYWSAESGFAGTRTVTATAVTTELDVRITFTVACPIEVYPSPSAHIVPLRIRGRQFLDIAGHRTAAHWGTTFVVNTMLSNRPPITTRIEPKVQLTDRALAALPLGSVIDPARHVRVDPPFNTYPPSGPWLNGTFAFTILANSTLGENDFEVTYEVTGSEEYGANQQFGLAVVADSRIAISGWREVLVASAIDSFWIDVIIAEIPPFGSWVDVKLDTLSDAVEFDPPAITFRRFSQQLTSVSVKVTPRAATDGTVTYSPAVTYASADHNYTAMALPLTVLGRNGFQSVQSSSEIFPDDPVYFTLTPNYVPISAVTVRATIECDATCQNNILLDGEAAITPSTLVWQPGDGTSARFTVNSSVTGKNFLVVLELTEDVRGLFSFPTERWRVTGPPKRLVRASEWPAAYVGGQYPITLSPTYAPAASSGTSVRASVALSEAVLTCSPAVLIWGAGGVDAATPQTTLCTPTIANQNVSVGWDVVASVRGFSDTPPVFIDILPSTAVAILGLRDSAYVGASIVELRFELEALPALGDTLQLVATSNDTVALSPEPQFLDLSFGAGASSVIALYPGRVQGIYADVELTFDARSASGRFVPSQRKAIVRVYRPRTIRLIDPLTEVSVGSTRTISFKADSPTDPVVFTTNYVGGEEALVVQPSKLYYSRFSPIQRYIAFRGVAPTGKAERFSVAALNSDEFFGAVTLRDIIVSPVSAILVNAPSTIRTTNTSTMTVTLTSVPVTDGSILLKMVTVTPVAVPGVLIFDPPSVTFNSDERVKTMSIRGPSQASGVKVTFPVTGGYRLRFAAPEARAIDIVTPNVIRVDLAASVNMLMGSTRKFIVALPYPLESYDRLTVTPTLSCPSLATVIRFSVSTLSWTSESALEQELTMFPVIPTAACSLIFSAGGNSTTVQGSSGVWSVRVSATPRVTLAEIPTALYASTQSTSALKVALTSVPPVPFAVTLVVASNVSQSVSVAPGTVSWDADSDPLDLERTWSIQVNDTSLRSAVLYFVFTPHEDINASLIATPLVLDVEPTRSISVNGLPGALYLGGLNAKSFRIVLGASPVLGERIDVKVAYTGAQGSLKIEPASLSWIGGQSTSLESTVTLEAVLPQGLGEIVLDITAPPRFGSRVERHSIVLSDLVQLELSPDFPDVLYPMRTYSFTVSLPERLLPQALPGPVSVVPNFLGRANCLRPSPTFLRFGPTQPASQTIEFHVTDGNCGTALFSLTTDGWNALRPLVLRKSVTVLGQQSLKMTRWPGPMRVGEQVLVEVDAVVDPEVGTRVEVAFHRNPNDPCLEVLPAIIVWTGGDGLPLKRTIRLRALCATSAAIRVLPDFFGTTSLIHGRFLPEMWTRVDTALPMPVSAIALPHTIYAGPAASYPLQVLDANAMMDYVSRITFTATDVYRLNPFYDTARGFSKGNRSLAGPILQVNGVSNISGVGDYAWVDLSRVVTSIVPLPLQGFTPGGEFLVNLTGYPLGISYGPPAGNGTNATVNVTSPVEVLSIRNFRVLAPMRMIRGSFNSQGNVTEFAYYRYEDDDAGYAHVNLTFDYDRHRLPNGWLDYRMIPGEATRVFASLQINALPELSDDITSTSIPSVTLTAAVSDSSLLFVNPSSVTFTAGGKTTQTVVLLAADIDTERNVTLQWVATGPSRTHVLPETLLAMRTNITVVPKFSAIVSVPPTSLLVGASRSAKINVTVPYLDQSTQVFIDVAGSRESISLSTKRFAFFEVDTNMLVHADPVTGQTLYTRSFEIVGTQVTNAPARLVVTVEGARYKTEAQPTDTRAITVVPLQRLTMKPDLGVLATQTTYLAANNTYVFSPAVSSLLCTAMSVDEKGVGTPSDAVSAFFVSSASMLSLVGRSITPRIVINCVIDPSSPEARLYDPPLPFAILVRERKRLAKVGVIGAFSVFDMFFDAATAMQITASEVPDEGTELIVTPESARADSYVSVPSSIAFDSFSSATAVINFIGAAEQAETGMLLRVSGTAAQQYNATGFELVRFTVRRRASVNIVELLPNRSGLMFNQWVGFANRQVLTVQLDNRTNGIVTVVPRYLGPAGSVTFSPTVVNFPAAFSGDPVRTQIINVVAQQPADPASIEFLVEGPPELNQAKVVTPEVRFLARRRVVIDRDFAQQLFVLTRNQRQISARLSNPVDAFAVTLSVQPRGNNSLIDVSPSTLTWNPEPNATDESTVLQLPTAEEALSRSLATSQGMTVTGVAGGYVTLALSVSTRDTRFDLTLDEPLVTVRIRDLISFSVKHDGARIDGSSQVLYAGTRNPFAFDVLVDDLPVSNQSSISIIVVPSTEMVVQGTAAEEPLVFGRLLRQGLTTATVTVNARPRTEGADPSVVALLPEYTPPTARQGLVEFEIQGPSEVLGTTRSAGFSIYDLLTFQVIDFDERFFVGVENPTTFQIRPRVPVPSGSLWLRAESTCGEVTVSLDQEEAWSPTTAFTFVTVTMWSSNVRPKDDGCRVRLLVDYGRSSSTIFSDVAFDHVLDVVPRPRVELVQDLGFVDAVRVREQGVRLQISISQTAFAEATAVTLLNARYIYEHGNVNITSTVSEGKEPNSVSAYVSRNASELISLSFSENRTDCFVDFNPLEDFQSFSDEVVTIKFLRSTTADDVSFEPGYDSISFDLQREAARILTRTQRQLFAQVFGGAVVINGLFFAAPLTTPGKLLTLIYAPECPLDPESHQVHFTWVESVFPLTIGSLDEDGGYIGGAVANVAAIGAAAALHFTLVLVVYNYRNFKGTYQELTLHAAIAKVSFPTMPIIAVGILFQNTVAYGLRGVLASSSLAIRSVGGIIAVTLAAGVPTFLVAFLILDFNAKYVDRSGTTDDERIARKRKEAQEAYDTKFAQKDLDFWDRLRLKAELLKNLPSTFNSKGSFFAHQGTWRHPRDEKFNAKYGILYTECRAKRHPFLLVDITFVLVLAVIQAVMSSATREVCVAQHALLALMFLAQFVGLVVLRPFDRVFHNVVMIAIAFMELLVAMLVFGGSAANAGNYPGLQAAAFVITLITILLLVKMIADLTFYFLFFFDLQDRTAAKRDTTLDVKDDDAGDAVERTTVEVNKTQLPNVDPDRLLPLPESQEDTGTGSSDRDSSGVLAMPLLDSKRPNPLNDRTQRGVGGGGPRAEVNDVALRRYLDNKDARDRANEYDAVRESQQPKTYQETLDRRREKVEDFRRRDPGGRGNDDVSANLDNSSVVQRISFNTSSRFDRTAPQPRFSGLEEYDAPRSQQDARASFRDIAAPEPPPASPRASRKQLTQTDQELYDIL